MALLKNSDYAIRIATTADKPALLEFLNRYFYTDEPLNEAVNRAKNETKIRTLTDSPMDYLQEGLTLLAVEPSGEIIGIALNAEVKIEEIVYGSNENSARNLNPIHKLLDHIEEKITELSKGAGNIKELEVRVIAIHESWRNKGLGRILLEHSKNLAQEEGFKQIRSICTSAYTAKMFERSGFECIYILEYKDCKEKGIIEFLPQEPHTHIKGMVLKF